MRKLQRWQMLAVLMVIYDMVALVMAHFMALWLRFDMRFSMIPTVYLQNVLNLMPWMGSLSILLLWRFRLYQSIWRYASVSELLRILTVSGIISVVEAVLIFSGLFHRMPVSYYFVGYILSVCFLTAVRFGYRFILLMRQHKDVHRKKALVIGAGQAGQLLIRDAKRDQWSDVQICAVIDDDPNKRGRYIGGVPVVGNRDDILRIVAEQEIDEIYLAIPGAGAKAKRDILDICKETGCVLRNLPSLQQMARGEVTMKELRDVAIEDLLGREAIKVDLTEIFNSLTDKVVLVTGGGGSIGSELCRQIANHSPQQLIILDIYENNAHEIENELRKKYPSMNLVVLIGSVRDAVRINGIFAEYRPDIVYHAAAHKHVPLMEYSPCEAIKNNVYGTYCVAWAAARYGTQKMVLISTDKAVNPTNVMGASKRICELVVQTFDKMGKLGKEMPRFPQFSLPVEDDSDAATKVTTEYVAVRFGNVLGSNGSVVPFFKKQIAAGGPVTVTHPDIVRYFMTIPEAVSLVLQAGTYAHGGEIFVFDMGEPVKIDTLARNLIKLSGLQPDVDIPIVYVGLRPGEKLYEEKLMAAEGLQKTANDLIYVGHPLNNDTDCFMQKLQKIVVAAFEERLDSVLPLVKELVPEYAGRNWE